MTFKRLALFMIREKYHDLDFSDINFTDMKGYDIPDPTDGLIPIGDLNVKESVQAMPDQPVEEGSAQVE